MRKYVVLGTLLLGSLPTSDLSARENLEAFTRALMRGRRGAIIAANPATGELLAVWNPRTAFDQAFPPGSTAKLVASAAALEEGVIAPSDRVLCRRVPELLGKSYACSHSPPDAPFTLTVALANSCNFFFTVLSVRLSPAILSHWYGVFGFGSPLHGLGSGAAAGQVHVASTPAAKAKAALGEGSVLVTPAQLLLAYSAIATRGLVHRLCQPRAGRRNSQPIIRRVKLQPETFANLAAGLEECVRSGTCQAAAVPGMRVAGKTGTPTALDGSGTTHAWFVGYAPAEQPEIAVVVFLERGTGAHDAAPLAGQILKHYFAVANQKP